MPKTLETRLAEYRANHTLSQQNAYLCGYMDAVEDLRGGEARSCIVDEGETCPESRYDCSRSCPLTGWEIRGKWRMGGQDMERCLRHVL